MRDEQRGHHESCDFETKPAPSAGEAKPEGRGDETTKSHATLSKTNVRRRRSGEKRGFGEGLDASDKFRDVEVDHAMPAAPGAATDAYGWGAYPYLWGTSTTAPPTKGTRSSALDFVVTRKRVKSQSSVRFTCELKTRRSSEVGEHVRFIESRKPRV